MKEIKSMEDILKEMHFNKEEYILSEEYNSIKMFNLLDLSDKMSCKNCRLEKICKFCNSLNLYGLQTEMFTIEIKCKMFQEKDK